MTADLRARLIALADELSESPMRHDVALAAAKLALETALADCETGAQRWPVMRARVRALAAGLDK